MSSVPPSFYEPWTGITRPSHLMDQRFGAVLDPVDFCTPLIYPFSTMATGRSTSNYYRPWRPITTKDDYGTTLMFDKSKFEATLDVQQFAPNEIMVKVIGHNNIVVEAKHEEKLDQHGYVSRQFVRRYILPDGHDMDNVVSSLSSDGVLTITAPKFDVVDEHRSIPILQTGFPVLRAATPAQGSVAVKTSGRASPKAPGSAPAVSVPEQAQAAAAIATPAKPKSDENTKEEKQDDEKKE